MSKKTNKIIFFVITALALILVAGLCLFYAPWYFAAPAVTALFLVTILLGKRPPGGPNEQPIYSAEAGSEKDQFKSIISAIEDGLVVYNKDFTILFFNSAAERLFGIQQKEVVGKKIEPQNVETQGLKRLVQVLFPTLAPTMTPRSKAGEYPQIVDLSFDAPYLELRTITSPVSDGAGGLSGFMKIVRDRTREASLVKSKNEFITVASHQLRTPITNVGWTLESLAGNSALDATTKTLVENALVSVKQLRGVVEDLLNISKIEEGRFGYQFEEMSLSAFLEKILAEALPQARRVGIALYFDKPPEELSKVRIDPNKLSMAVSNFLDNAIRYNTQSGKVTVEIKNEAPFLKVSIKDTGIGIPKEDLQKLFTRFFRAGNAVKSAADGSGLGLYIAQNIIHAHGGKVWVESELGRGTTFYFTIPTDPSLIPPKEVPLEF
ncbi:MAG: ATP-binding protein [Patescibacteria group bacterium]